MKTIYPVPHCVSESPPYQTFTWEVYADGDKPVTYDRLSSSGEPDNIHFLNGPTLANRLVKNGWSSPLLSGRYAEVVTVECHQSSQWGA